MFEVTCKDCGCKYLANRNRDGYCETCRSERIAQTKRKYYEHRKVNNNEMKDQLSRCVKCGKLFNAVNSRQTLCGACQLCKEREQHRQETYKNRREKADCIQFRVQKGKRKEIKAYAAERGMNITELILESLKLYTGMEL